MSSAKDFVIENGVLVKYAGEGGDVVIPDGVTQLSDYVFSRNENLKSVRIPDSVTSIGAMTFYECTKLKEIVIPDSVTTVGALAFHNCKRLADGNGLVVVHNTVWGYFGLSGEVVIPDGVVKIADKAFFECRGLTKVVIPDSVISIGRNAFSDCRILMNAEIPTSVTDIGDNAFSGCECLADDDGFVIIRDVLYGYYGRNKTVTVPQYVARIADMAFCRCSNLETIVIPEDTALCKKLLSDHTEPKSAAVPDLCIDPVSGETVVVSVPVAVRNNTIGKDLFSGSTKLKAIIAPAVPFEYFNESKRPIPAIVGFLSHRKEYKIPAIVDEYIKKAVSQKKKVLPILFESDMVQGIEVFANAGKIMVKTVDEEFMNPAMAANATQCVAFLMDWKNKNNTEGPVEKMLGDELSKDPFNTSDMKKLWSFEKLADGTLEITGYKGEETEMVIPERIGKLPVTSIGKEAFSPDKEKRPKKQAEVLRNIRSVSIPESVRKISAKAFYGCEKLADTNGFVIVRDVLYNYYGTEEDVVIPEGVTVIGSRAFGWCENLKCVTIPEGVTIIGEQAFISCGNLESVDIPNGVITIGNDAFDNCGKLEKVNIPESVITIGDHAFSLCYQLSDVNIPESVTDIGDMAFFGCRKLADPYEFVVINHILFDHYGFNENIEIPEGVTHISGHAFSGNRKMTSVRLPESLISIGTDAFSDCVNLTDITLPEGLQLIREKAFANCCKIESITVPGYVSKICDHVFFRCQNLHSVAFCNGVKSLGAFIFEGCGNLTSVTVPESVTEIDRWTFAYCSDDLTIHAPAGSYAETYAKENDIPFETE